ncbi:MAG: heme exporter protein CcmD [Xanthomonadales bacterium]|nr:heme exporter protein CcmD [Xanthomonadales bacterium]
MMDALAMGKYGVYVWSSYGAFAVFLLWDWLAPRFQRRRLLRGIEQRARRDSAREQKKQNA